MNREQIAKAIARDLIMTRGTVENPREVTRAIEDHYEDEYVIHDTTWTSERVFHLIEHAVVTITWEAKA